MAQLCTQISGIRARTLGYHNTRCKSMRPKENRRLRLRRNATKHACRVSSHDSEGRDILGDKFPLALIFSISTIGGRGGTNEWWQKGNTAYLCNN